VKKEERDKNAHLFLNVINKFCLATIGAVILNVVYIHVSLRRFYLKGINSKSQHSPAHANNRKPNKNQTCWFRA